MEERELRRVLEQEERELRRVLEQKEREMRRSLKREQLEQRNAEWPGYESILYLYPACNFPRGIRQHRIPWYTSGFQ